MAGVFISYSRANIDFARRLAQELRAANYDLWIDLEGIRFTADWWEEIRRGIEHASNFLVVMSPSSLGSPVCHLEIEYARKLNKRIILLNHLPVQRSEASRAMLERLAGDAYVNTLLGDRNPMMLFDNNWYVIEKYQRVDFCYDADKSAKFAAGETETDLEQAAREAEEGAFLKHFANLREALELDLDHANFHTRLGLRTRDWQRNEENDSFLLFGDELLQAERWLTDYDADVMARAQSGATPKLPRPTDDQRAYLKKSRVVETARAHRLRNLRRAGIGAGLVAGLMLIFAIGASLIGVNAVNDSRAAQAFVLAANQTLTPIPQTITAAQAAANSANQSAQAARTQVAVIGVTVQAGNAQLVTAQTQVAAANATLTPVPPTLTAVAVKADAAGLAANAINEFARPNASAELTALLAIRSLKQGYTSAADTALQWAANRLYGRLIVPQSFSVNVVAASPDGKYMLVGGKNNDALLWDLQALLNGQPAHPRRLIGHTYDVSSAAFSPDGKYVLTGSWDKQARLWDVASGQLVHTLTGHSDFVASVAFSPDGKYALTGGWDRTARLWDLATAQTVLTFKGHTDAVDAVAFSPDGKYVLTGSYDATARLWDATNGLSLRTLSGHFGNVQAVAFSPDAKYILTGGRDNTVRLWDATTGKTLLFLNGHTNYVLSVAFSPDSKYIVTGSGDRTARLWNTSDGQLLRTFTGHTANVNSVAFTPDGKYALTGSADSTARVWNVASRESYHILAGHNDYVNGVTFSPDGKYALTASGDNTARLWDVASGQTIRIFTGHTKYVKGVAFSPDGKYAVTGSEDGTARLWDVANGQFVRAFVGHTAGVGRVAVSNDGKYVLTAGGDFTARLWDIASGREVHTFVGHTSYVLSVALSPDGKYVLTGGDDSTARLWDAVTGQALYTVTAHSSYIDAVAFSPDGKYFATGGGDNTARLWDVASGAPLRTLTGHTAIVTSVAFSPDGRYVLTGSSDNTARLWDVPSGTLLRTFAGHNNVVLDVAFSPDGKYILTGSQDTTARLSEVDYRDLIASVCSQLLRDMTHDERIQAGIQDNTATCPKFADDNHPLQVPVITPTALPLNMPVWTPIASPTIAATSTSILPGSDSTPGAADSIYQTAEWQRYVAEDRTFSLALPSGWQAQQSHDDAGYDFNSGLSGMYLHVLIAAPATVYQGPLTLKGSYDSPAAALNVYSALLSNSSDYKGTKPVPWTVDTLRGVQFHVTWLSKNLDFDIRIASLPNGKVIYVCASASSDIWNKAQPVLGFMIDSIRLGK